MRCVLICFCLVNMVFAESSKFLDGKQSNIPVLDLSMYYNLHTRDQFIKEVRSALHNLGFFAVKNTGVNPKVINDLYSSLKVFFDYDLTQKMKISAAETNNQRGYTSFGQEAAKGSLVGDNKEFYSMGKELTQEQAKTLGSWVNKWPDFIDLKTPAIRFYDVMDQYSVIFQEIFSQALGEDPDFLQEVCKNGDSSCRMIHYPIVKKTEKNTEWAKEHTDIDLFTILPKATVDGLEVFDEKNGWQKVCVKEDAFIINAGDFLEIFSNGYFKSAPHRVMAPKHMKTDRYSSVFFVHPRSESLLYPLSQWVEITGGKEKYIKATRLEMLMERLADLNLASDGMLKQLAQSKVLERLLTVNRASVEAMRAIQKAGYSSEIIDNELIKH